ncbi:hypothetical protein ACLKMY_31310 [Paraburkholderia mimosarum]|nr:hypothetical protein [Paraburkholderia mimosarum]
MAYLFTSRTVVASLIAAHRRGVDVAVTVDYRNNIEEDRSGRARGAWRTCVRRNSGAHDQRVRFSAQQVRAR